MLEKRWGNIGSCPHVPVVLLINLYYTPDPPFLLHATLETALTHLRWGPIKPLVNFHKSLKWILHNYFSK